MRRSVVIIMLIILSILVFLFSWNPEQERLTTKTEEITTDTQTVSVPVSSPIKEQTQASTEVTLQKGVHAATPGEVHNGGIRRERDVQGIDDEVAAKRHQEITSATNISELKAQQGHMQSDILLARDDEQNLYLEKEQMLNEFMGLGGYLGRDGVPQFYKGSASQHDAGQRRRLQELKEAITERDRWIRIKQDQINSQETQLKQIEQKITHFEN